MDLAVNVYRKIILLLPFEEKYALASQLRRSAQCIPANVAEGYGRYYYQEHIRFCYIARGSLEETVSHLVLAHKLGYFSENVLQSSMQLTDELRRILNGYIAFLKRSKRGENEPGSHQTREDSEYFSIRESMEFTDDLGPNNQSSDPKFPDS